MSKKLIKKCVICGREFNTSHPIVVVCSDLCRLENKRRKRLKVKDKDRYNEQARLFAAKKYSKPENRAVKRDYEREYYQLYRKHGLKKQRQKTDENAGNLCSLKVDLDIIEGLRQKAKALKKSMSEVRRMAYKEFLENHYKY